MVASYAVAVGVIVNSAQEVLLSKRSSQVDQAGLWEYPGGKVEKCEDVYQALVRELKEELGIEVCKAHRLIDVWHDYRSHTVLLYTWVVTEFKHRPQALEGQPLQWVPFAQLDQVKLPAANYAITVALRQYYSTPRISS